MKTKKAKKKVSKKKAVKKATQKPSKKPKKVYEHHPDHYNTSESFLIKNLDEELQDAWFKIREFGASLGHTTGDEKAQKIYASGRAIMFSKKVCYFFVRPQKSYLEVVIFLREPREDGFFRTIKAVSKTKYAHTFRLVHSDQVEGELTEAIRQAFDQTPAA